MRLTGRLRYWVTATVLAGVLVLPAGAQAQLNSFDVATSGVLFGAGEAAVPVTVNCEPGDFLQGDFALVQTNAGFVSFGRTHHELTCTGADQRLLLPFRSDSAPFLGGKSLFSGCVAFFDDDGSPILGDEIGPLVIRLRERVRAFAFVNGLSGKTGCFE